MKTDQTPKPKRYLLGRIVVAVLRVVVSVLLKLEIVGADRVPQTGPVLLIGNHINFLDPVLANTVLHRYIKGLTAVETYRRFLFRFLAWSVDAIPVERGTPDRSAIRACVTALESNWALYIAPEGTRSGHGRMQRGYAGVTLVILAAGTDIPVYPMGFAGLENFWPNLRRLRRTPVRVTVGEPFTVVPPAGRVRQDVREEIITEMMGQIARLLPPENRGLYADQVDRPPVHLRRVSEGSVPQAAPRPVANHDAHAAE